MFMDCDMVESFIVFFRYFLCDFMSYNFWNGGRIFGFVFMLRLILKSLEILPYNGFDAMQMDWMILIESFFQIALSEWLDFRFFPMGISSGISLTNFAFNEGTPAGCLDVIEGGVGVLHFFFHGFGVFLFEGVDFVV